MMMTSKSTTSNPGISNYMQMLALSMLVAAAAWIWIANRPSGAVLAPVCLGGVLLAPPAIVWTRRTGLNLRRQRTEERLVSHTIAYLRSQESAAPAARAEARPATEAGFRDTRGSLVRRPPAGEMVVFDTMPMRLQAACPALPRFGLSAVHHLPEAETNPALACWKSERHQVTIEYARPVLEEIRMAAVEGYQRMRHGGVEVGGVLFGRRRERSVEILAVRAIACEYAQGPRFVLSESDEAALTEMLGSFRHDPELSDLEPVGWYHSHTRSEIALSEQDVAFYSKFFPLRWQVALVVRPATLAPSRAGFFFREMDGQIRTDASYREFQLVAPARTAVAA
jgi:proteasome lid subunit RPN8/RPN11